MFALFFAVTMQPILAQSEYVDSLRTVLTGTTKPIDRFRTTVKILENNDSYLGNTIDSATCIELLQIAQQLKNDSLLAISYNWIGYFLNQAKGDNTTALEYFFKALPLAQEVNDKRRISSLYFDIASVYFLLQNMEAYIDYTRKGGENLPDKSSPMHDYMLVQYQRNMGTYFLEINQADSALYFVQAMEQTSIRLKSILFRYQAMTLIAYTNAKMGENELADIYFKKALIIADSIQGNLRKFVFYKRYIPFLINNSRIEEAKPQIETLWTISQQNNNPNYKLLAAGFKRELFEKLHQTDSAYYFSRMEADTKDSNLNIIQSLAFKEQLRMIEDTAKKSAEEDQRKQNIQFALLALGIITFIILFLLLSRSFITNTKMIEFLGVIALLIVFEFLNLLLHPFLERVTHHSPVLMLLALVCIAALLVPLHHKLEKWATTKLVEKNKTIRLAAAKKTIEKLEKQPG